MLPDFDSQEIQQSYWAASANFIKSAQFKTVEVLIRSLTLEYKIQSLLDIGAGNGIVAVTLRDILQIATRNVTTIDVSELACEKCQNRGFRSLYGDFCSVVVGETYQLVTCFNTIYYFGDRIKDIARKVVRILDSPGFFLVTFGLSNFSCIDSVNEVIEKITVLGKLKHLLFSMSFESTSIQKLADDSAHKYTGRWYATLLFMKQAKGMQSVSQAILMPNFTPRSKYSGISLIDLANTSPEKIEE